MSCKSGPALTIPASIELIGVAGIKKFISDNDLDDTSPLRVISSTSKRANADTMKSYHARWLEMRKFCFLIGDYQSATLLYRTMCPRNPFPIKPETVVEYYDYKTNKKGTKLLNSVTKEPRLDITGQPIYCVESWHAPGPLQKFKSSLRVLHEAYDRLQGPYQPVCVDCQKFNTHGGENSTGVYGSCRSHAGTPWLVPGGNVVYHQSVVNAHFAKLGDVGSWQRQGCIQLLPGEVRVLRQNLCSTGKLSDLQMYAMILVGIKLFLRADELLCLTIEQFEPGYQIVNSKEINSICCWIQGKTDRMPVRLQLFSDKEYPEFCPISHLLVYLAWSGIKSGYMFPSRRDTDFGQSEGETPTAHVEQHWMYSDWLTELRQKYLYVLKRPVNRGSLGTHTLRKTGYLFAVWGVLRMLGVKTHERVMNMAKLPDLQLGNILKSARHKTLGNAATYQKDCHTQLCMVLRERYSEIHAVGSWDCCFIETLDTARTITLPSKPYQKPLPELAIFFVEKILDLKVERTTPVMYVIEVAKQQVAKLNPQNQLSALLDKSCSSTVKEEVTLLFESALKEEVEAITEFLTKQYGTAVATTTMPVAGLVTPSPAKKRKTRGEGNTADIPSAVRDEILRETDRNAQVRRRYEIYSEYSDCASSLNEGSRQWYMRHVRKVGLCVSTCFDHDVPRFVEDAEHRMDDDNIRWYKYHCAACMSKKMPGKPRGKKAKAEAEVK